MLILLTDFGLQDTYVAEMKGICMRHTRRQIIDLTHAVTPGDVRHGQFLLKTAHKWFPAGSVFIGVVDPGVGTDREAVAVRLQDQWFVGPDNGIFSFAAEDGRVFRIVPDEEFPEQLSDTFHGRDLFAPAGARIATGDTGFLEPCDGLTRISEIRFIHSAPDRSEIFHIDRFGNMVTGISSELFNQITVRIGNVDIFRHCRNFAEGPEGPFLLPGSRGLLEITVKDRSAAELLNAAIGDEIEVLPK